MSFLASIAASVLTWALTKFGLWLADYLRDLALRKLDEAENAKNRKELEDAKTDEERKHAAEELARRLGRHP